MPHHAIDASPTKRFFISMLVRDVKLARAIIDLIDNCIDGALRAGDGTDFSPFQVRLMVTPERFEIADNCGGMDLEVAEKYAFRFGRPSEAAATEGSVGQFGVGMKRTIFKLGSQFKVTSTTATRHFVIEGNVEEWLSRADDWTFAFSKIEDRFDVPRAEQGVSVEISALHESVRDDFGRPAFLAELRSAIEEAHALRMQAGLSITLNGIPLGVEEFRLLSSDRLVPAYAELHVPPPTGKQAGVTIRMYAGVSDRSLNKGGWYVFCNGRQVLAADQTSTTGWASVVEAELEGSKEEQMRKYHADFAYFRGFVFFDSIDASLLPWTTTKTGVDTDSPIYRLARREMQRIMRPVIKFLSELAAETSEKNADVEAETPLHDALQGASGTSVSKVATSTTFVQPERRRRRMDAPQVSIQYRKDREKVELAKRRLGVSTATEVGDATFDYFFQAECE